MRASKLTITGLLAALLLAACGGGDPTVPGSGSTAGAPTTKGTFTALVSFGDSLSDVGTYTPATSVTGNGVAPYIGGKFTTNGTAGKVWVENLAATVGVPVSVAEVGFAGQSQKCPAAASPVPAIAASCTAYGQGGARVTDPNGIGHSGGALTVPVVTQIANHLTRFGSFKDSDLIIVYAGNNDVFAQFSAFATAAGTIQAQAAAGAITPEQANQQLFAAQTAAFEAMKVAAQELSGYVRNQIVAKGGKYVAVVTLSDIADTPFGNSAQVAPARGVLTELSQIFNVWLRDGLTGAPVQIIDAYALFKEAAANAAAHGFTNITVPACDAAKIATLTGNQVIDGSSLFCNADPGPLNGLRTGADVNTWFFADSVHPTSGAHRLIADDIAAALRGFGWL
jgi:phospholipase/lecithinase/hemolysin